MATELMGIIVTKGKVEATYRYEALGAKHVHTKRDNEWPQNVKDASKALVDLLDALTPELDDVVEVQLYSEITDREGQKYAEPGETVDVEFRDRRRIRLGEMADIAPEIAKARDALKSAVVAAL